MNIFVQRLAAESVDPSPELRPRTLVVEDNVGESVHVHLRNLRLEMSVDDFDTFAGAVAEARAQVSDGNR